MKKEETLKDLIEFNSLYSRRPIYDNSGGMKSPQMFGLYRWLKYNNPDLIIESGVWKGQGTWLIRQMCPNSEIISIDVDLSNLIFSDKTTTYYDKDIKYLDLKRMVSSFDSEKVLVFFDDHQNFNERIDLLISSGIKHVIFEDNYPLGQGDCISPKKIISSKGFIEEKNLKMSYEDINNIKRKMTKYREFPPIFVDKMTRWNIPWSYDTMPPVLDHSESDKYEQFFKERFDYTWICYVGLKP